MRKEQKVWARRIGLGNGSLFPVEKSSGLEQDSPLKYLIYRVLHDKLRDEFKMFWEFALIALQYPDAKSK